MKYILCWILRTFSNSQDIDIEWNIVENLQKSNHKAVWKLELELASSLTTVFVDTLLWKTKHPRKRFQNFCQSYVLLTDQIEIHQSQPLAWPSDLLFVMLADCDWWISIQYVDNT